MNDDRYGPTRPFDALNPRGLAGKREYVRGLEQRGDAEALSLLVECLCDESWYLRDQAEQALARIGPDVAPMLLPLLEQGLWFTRTSAARVLGGFGHRPGVPALLRISDDANETVSGAAARSAVPRSTRCAPEACHSKVTLPSPGHRSSSRRPRQIAATGSGSAEQDS